jgi:nitrite reductase/ring-hydroxylating ferredoxin subunit
MVWKKIAEKDSKIPKGEAQEFDIDGKKITVINQDGLFAIDTMCVHQDQPITCGKIEGDVIECPHHFWHYNYKTGKLLDYLKDISLSTYNIEEKNDGIYIDI